MQPGLPLNSKSFCLLLGVRITDVCCYIWLNIPLGQKVATLTKGAILLVSATVKSIPTSTSKCQHFCSDRTDSQAQPSFVTRLQKACFPKELPQFYLLCCNLTWLVATERLLFKASHRTIVGHAWPEVSCGTKSAPDFEDRRWQIAWQTFSCCHQDT